MRVPQAWHLFGSPLHLVPHLLAALEEVHRGLGARLQEVHDHVLLQQLHAKVGGGAGVVLELRKDDLCNFRVSLLKSYHFAEFL